MGTCIVPVAPWQEADVTDFNGSWTRPDPTDVPPNRALLSLNAEYFPGQVSTRCGFAQLWNPNKIITSLFNWIKAADAVSAKGNYLLVYNKTDGKVQWATNMASPSLTDLFTVAADAVNASSSGNQLFLPTVDTSSQTTPVGASQCRIVGIYGAAVNVDKAFLGPLSVKPTLTEPSAGSVTAGLHFVGFLITTRNGYTGQICPISGVTLQIDQTSVITSGGGKNISGSLSTTWPVEANTITIVMTATNNPYQYFTVPGAVYGVPGGSPFTINFTIDIPDTQLIADQSADVTSNQFLLSQSLAGAGPFSPWKVGMYGERAAYMTYDGNGVAALYFSDPANPQSLTEQFHKRHLPGFLQMTDFFVVGSTFYALGPNWTYKFQDNNGLPVTWEQPPLVDGSIGTPCFNGTTTSASGDWAAVVHTTGLYIFNGNYPDKPLSYMNDDQWRRINWAAAQTIRIVDNKDKKQILVLVPLDGSTVPNYLMCWDYSNGLDYMSIQYSLWNVSGYNPRALTVWQNVSTLRHEFLLADSVAGPVLRQTNTTDDPATWPFDQGANSIDFEFEVGPQPEGAVGHIYAFPAMYVRATGSGTPTVTSYSLDRTIAKQWTRPINLQQQPGKEYYRQFYLFSERCSTRFVSGVSAGDWMMLSGIKQCYYEYAARRS
jgi:hypothetical protein